jgi:acyl carrier protein
MTHATARELSGTKSRTDATLRQVLADVLGRPRDRVAAVTRDTGLFGHLPELDSMAVAGLLTEIEDRLAIVIDDDEVDGEMLETYGALLAFCKAKLQG